MADQNRWITYYIVLTDPALVAQYQAQYPFGYGFAPFNPHDNTTGLPGGAAVAFNAPWAGSFPGTDPNHVTIGDYFGPAPYTWCPEWTSANNYDCTVATFERKSGGFWGIGGTTVRYRWLGQFVLDAPAVPTIAGLPPTIVQAPPIRRFIEGFEFGAAGIENTLATGQHVTRDASRHVGGMGYAMRGATNSAGGIINQDAYGATLNFRTWMRMYIRLRKPDTTNAITFWGTHGLTSSGEGVQLGITADAKLGLFSTDVSSVRSLIATTTDALPIWDGRPDNDCWQKVDVLLRYNPNEAGPPVISSGQARVFLNGVEVLTAGGVNAWDGTVTYHVGNVVQSGGTNWKAIAESYVDAIGDTQYNKNKVPGAFPQLWASVAVPTFPGLASNQTHKSSFIGNPSATANFLELDIDDWMESDWPGPAETAVPPGPRLTGPDWLNGTKIVAARAKAFGTNHSVNWVGDLRVLLQNLFSASVSTPSTITSSTSGAIAEVDLDIDQCVRRDAGVKGISSFMVQAFTTRSAGAQGQLGYILDGGAPVMSNIAEGASLTGFAVRKSIADNAATVLGTITTLTARKTKGADANAGTIAMMGAQLELNGIWGKPDYRVTENGPDGLPAFPHYPGIHNAPYPFTTFANGDLAPPPNAAVIITTGTYVGNNTGQDITFRTPPHFLFIRPLSGSTGGFKWWSSMINAHQAAGVSVSANLARFDEDVTFVPGLGVDVQQQRYRMRIAGSGTQINATGVTYQYVAFSDPGARFALAGSLVHPATAPTVDNPLVNSNFLAEAGLFFGETADGTSTSALYFKGLGTAAGALMRWTTSAQIASALDFILGKITTQPAAHALHSSINLPFILFRRHDGNNDPGEPGVMALANWTGDGNASRTISLAPTSGKRPIFVMAFASDAGGGFMRDPSHTTNTSDTNTGGSSTTGITGGAVDSFSVGISLNSNLINYSAIVFLGSATAGNGGFGVNGEFIPVEAAPPFDAGPWPPNPTPEQVNPPEPPPGPIFGEPDLQDSTILSTNASEIGGLVGGQTCEYYTRHIVNMALSRIGVSKRIAILSTENSTEAALARSHVLEDVNQVLRDFPWSFAKRYANLVLVAGTSTVPVNADWQYSYRAPAAMMNARRVANQNMIQKRYDPNPPRFEVGADDTGPLIFTNEVATTDVPLVLEYTVRSICPALYGDALFRDALAWKFAWSLAPVLSKDTKKQDYCRQMYVYALSKAQAGAAKEQQQAKPGDADWINDREFGPNAQPNSWPWGER